MKMELQKKYVKYFQRCLDDDFSDDDGIVLPEGREEEP